MNEISSAHALVPAALRAASTVGTQGDATTSTDLQGMNESQFLQLLVTQLKNQDPTSPLDNNQFVAQLATFSSLEQLISINKAVTKLSDGIATGSGG